MLSYGLKPYNVEDCEEALEISRSMKGETPHLKVNCYIQPNFPFMTKMFDTEASVPDEQSADGGSGSGKN